jgi:hypothetical protein
VAFTVLAGLCGGVFPVGVFVESIFGIDARVESVDADAVGGASACGFDGSAGTVESGADDTAAISVPSGLTKTFRTGAVFEAIGEAAGLADAGGISGAADFSPEP